MDRDSGFVPALSSVSFNLKVEMDINKDRLFSGELGFKKNKEKEEF